MLYKKKSNNALRHGTLNYCRTPGDAAILLKDNDKLLASLNQVTKETSANVKGRMRNGKTIRTLQLINSL